jgi:hypothetical protein
VFRHRCRLPLPRREAIPRRCEITSRPASLASLGPWPARGAITNLGWRPEPRGTGLTQTAFRLVRTTCRGPGTLNLPRPWLFARPVRSTAGRPVPGTHHQVSANACGDLSLYLAEQRVGSIAASPMLLRRPIGRLVTPLLPDGDNRRFRGVAEPRPSWARRFPPRAAASAAAQDSIVSPMIMRGQCEHCHCETASLLLAG